MLSLLIGSSALAEDVLLQLPSPSSNAALHYQRAILFLAEVDPKQRELLEKSIWEIVNSQTTPEQIDEINALLFASRHAVRSAMVGASQAEADFGTNLRGYVASERLPHVGPMASLAKLLTLHGLQKQAEGDSHRAAEIYLLVVRMGCHMQQQLTLAETLEGEEILETGYHALCNWAVRCSDPDLISSVRAALISLSTEHDSAARALGFEASVLKLALDDLELAYPEGNWAEIILTAVDVVPTANSPEAMREAAKAAVIKRGVPESVFVSEEAFSEHIEKLRAAYSDYYRASLDCFSLPPEAAIRAGQAVFDKFSPRLKALGDPDILNPGQIAAYCAVRQAEQQGADLVLLISAHRENDLFPADLARITEDFGGKLPESPFGSGEVVYTPTGDRKGFELHYPGSEIAGIKLPEVAFKFSSSEKP